MKISLTHSIYLTLRSSLRLYVARSDSLLNPQPNPISLPTQQSLNLSTIQYIWQICENLTHSLYLSHTEAVFTSLRLYVARSDSFLNPQPNPISLPTQQSLNLSVQFNIYGKYVKISLSLSLSLSLRFFTKSYVYDRFG